MMCRLQVVTLVLTFVLCYNAWLLVTCHTSEKHGKTCVVNDDKCTSEKPQKGQSAFQYPRKYPKWTRSTGEIRIQVDVQSIDHNNGHQTYTNLPCDVFLNVDSFNDIRNVVFYLMQNIREILFKEIIKECFLVVVELTSEDALHTLWKVYISGELNELFVDDIVTVSTKRRLNARSIKLDTTIPTWQYETCLLEFKMKDLRQETIEVQFNDDIYGEDIVTVLIRILGATNVFTGSVISIIYTTRKREYRRLKEERRKTANKEGELMDKELKLTVVMDEIIQFKEQFDEERQEQFRQKIKHIIVRQVLPNDLEEAEYAVENQDNRSTEAPGGKEATLHQVGPYSKKIQYSPIYCKSYEIEIFSTTQQSTYH